MSAGPNAVGPLTVPAYSLAYCDVAHAEPLSNLLRSPVWTHVAHQGVSLLRNQPSKDCC
jgi:hypothetical protein